MSDYSELKKQASIALSGGFLEQEEFRSHCRASVIGRLIDENERFRKQVEIEREFKIKTYHERDALIAENESLRKAIAWAIQVHRDPELEHEIRHEEWLEDLEVAMSSPENPS